MVGADHCLTDILPDLIKEYELLCILGEKVIGGKTDKDILTVLCCVNADGSHKLPMLVIGRSEKPRCLKMLKFYQ